VSQRDGDLSVYPEVAVVLGGGLQPDGVPTESTAARARAAIHLAHRRPDAGLVLSGSHGGGPSPQRTEAAVMADLLRESGVDPKRIFLEERSRDTLGNAVEVASLYLAKIEPRPLYLVTSPFHLERALVVFRNVLGFAWQVQAVAAAETDDDLERARKETFYLQETFAFFKGLTPGDFKAIEKRFRARDVR
jgi:uncharacterized SAM-binding protein YcdF (DUF218 family)